MVFFGAHASDASAASAGATYDGEHASPLESRTRSRVLHMVSADGPITAAELGRHLDLTPAAVRRHLDALVDQGAIEPHEPAAGRRGRGRPARAYVVSGAGHDVLDADYDAMAVDVLRYLAEHAGPEAVGDFARGRVAGLERRYAAHLAAAGTDPTARVRALVEALTADGYAASARPVGPVPTGSASGPARPASVVGTRVSAGAVVSAGSGAPTATGERTPLSGIQLCQGHCPVQHVAEEFPAFCEAETDAFSRLLGVHVQRLATLAGGHHVCTTFVPTGGISRKSASTRDVGTDAVTTTAPNTAPPAGTVVGRTSLPASVQTMHVKEGSPS